MHWQNDTKIWRKLAYEMYSCVQLLGGFAPPDPLTRGSAPGPRWGHSPQTPIIASRYRARHSPPNAKTKLRLWWHGYWASPEDCQTHHSHHPGHQRNSFPVSTPVHSSAAGECGLRPQHNEHRIRSRCSRWLTFCIVFTPAALCWWAEKNNNNNIFDRLPPARFQVNLGISWQQDVRPFWVLTVQQEMVVVTAKISQLYT